MLERGGFKDKTHTVELDTNSSRDVHRVLSNLIESELKKVPNSKYFRIGYAIIIVLVIILLATKVDFIFQPVEIFFETLFFPCLISGVLFYLLRPIVYFLHDKKVPKTLSILLIYLLVIGLGTIAILLVGPELQKQTKSLIDNSPELIEKMQGKTNELKESQWFSRFQENEYLTLDNINNRISDYFQSNVSDIGTRVSNALGMLTTILTVIVTVPFIVFYLLKDGEGASDGVLKFLPYFQAEEAKKIVRDMDGALSSYIQGQAIVSFIVGVMMYFGYLIIGLDYSLILAFIAMLTNVIPFVGPFIAIMPALAIAFMTSPFMALKVIIVAVIVQQIDGNVTSPLIMGRKLDLHPLTIILLLLVAGNMAGLIGMIVAVPAYAVLKVIVSHAYRLYMLRKVKKDNIIEVE